MPLDAELLGWCAVLQELLVEEEGFFIEVKDGGWDMPPTPTEAAAKEETASAAAGVVYASDFATAVESDVLFGLSGKISKRQLVGGLSSRSGGGGGGSAQGRIEGGEAKKHLLRGDGAARGNGDDGNKSGIDVGKKSRFVPSAQSLPSWQNNKKEEEEEGGVSVVSPGVERGDESDVSPGAAGLRTIQDGEAEAAGASGVDGVAVDSGNGYGSGMARKRTLLAADADVGADASAGVGSEGCDCGDGGEDLLKINSVWINIAFTAICVVCAGLAAGLTMGMVSIEPLEMAIKQRSGERASVTT